LVSLLDHIEEVRYNSNRLPCVSPRAAAWRCEETQVFILCPRGVICRGK
jgi:hypothetical protein